MSERPDDGGPELPEDEALAAEHALGVLTAAERAEAELRMARDPAFSAHVEAWRARLAPMLEALPGVEAPAELWARIVRALPANDNGALLAWRRAALGGFGLAAASIAAVVVLLANPGLIAPPPPPAQAPPALLNARLDTDKGQHLFVAAYDPSRHAVMVNSLVPAGTDPGHVHQLWLIPADGRPRSLGFVPVGASVALPLGDLAPMADQSAKLAVSVEGPGGSQKDGPTGPVVAVGQLTPV